MGIVSTNPGMIGNREILGKGMSALVGIMGQLPFQRDQVRIIRSEVYTIDHQFLGYLLSDGRVFINISPSSQALQRELKTIREEQKNILSSLRRLQARIQHLLD